MTRPSNLALRDAALSAWRAHAAYWRLLDATPLLGMRLQHLDTACLMRRRRRAPSRSMGSLDANTRALDHCEEMLARYEEPKLDPAVDEALRDFIRRRETELPEGVE